MALLSVPLVLSACVSEEMIDDSLGGMETSSATMTTTEGTSETTDGMTSETTTEGTTTEAEGCNTPSPYAGGWDIGCCQDEIVQNGWAPGAINSGTILPDWTMNDQFGDAVRIYDFCHDAIYFEYSAVW